MEIFDKKIDEITEKELLRLNSVFESNRIDYKITYKLGNPKDSNEFLRDVVSFANSFIDSLIIYGINDKRQIIGMARKSDFNEDKLQNHFINLLKSRIEPKIIGFINVQPISLKNDRFIMIVKVLSSNQIIFGIRQKLSKAIHGKEVDAYEFWIRSSGNKVLMNLNNVIHHILYKNKPNLKVLCFNNRLSKNITNLVKTTKTQYIKNNFRLKNIGELSARNISIRLYSQTDESIGILNKFNYRKLILKENDSISSISITDQLKKEKKYNSPSISPNKRKNRIFWSFQYEIDKVGPSDSLKLPPMYIKIPKGMKKGELLFDVRIISVDAVSFENTVLKLFWEL